MPAHTVLITGANRGIGLEFVRQYAVDGWRVIAACRNPADAAELATLASVHKQVSLHALDVADEQSVKQLARSVGDVPIDLLINNAGVTGPKAQTFGKVDYAGWMEAFQINALGPLRLCEAFVEQVGKSERKLMVSITSGMGSIGDSSGGYYVYRSTKAALNMVMHNVALDLKGRGIVCVVINPGWVKTDMGTSAATLTPAESIGAMRKIFDGLTLADTGKFLNWRGGTYEW